MPAGAKLRIMQAALATNGNFGPAHPSWRDWKAQLRHILNTPEKLVQAMPFLEGEKRAIEQVHDIFPLAITPYYLSLMEQGNPECPIYRQSVSDLRELERLTEGLDPLAEEAHRPGRTFLHRYPDRLLVYTGTHCGVICRHCTRKRLIGREPLAFGNTELRQVLDYLKEHPEVHEVILSGGDPFLLSDQRLLEILEALLQVPTLDLVRLHTRVPVTLPMRLSPSLGKALGSLGPVWCVTHFNHVRELSTDAKEALACLVNGGVPVLNQSVLLKGVNDRFEDQVALNRALLRQKVKPYYLHHGDRQGGAMHFRTSIEEGLDLMSRWQGHSGLLQPTYCVDGELGKIPLHPNQASRREEGWFVEQNFEGRSGWL